VKGKHEKYMRLALDMAEKARDKTYPNPMVGAVIVKGGRVVGKGYHKRAGTDHAEVAAIKSAGRKAKGASMYVTLEPCDHYGKTPPCTDAVIKAGIKKVHAAMLDPNPITGGKGVRKLRRSGIAVSVGMCANDARELNRKYIKYITTGLPYVTLKLAQSLDGRIAARDGSSRWITSIEARRYTRRMRPTFDAIMIGSNTAVKDDPFLLDEKRKGYDVSRVVVDSRLRMPLGSNLVRTADRAPLLVATTKLASEGKIRKLQQRRGVDVVTLRSGSSGVSLRALLRELASRGIVNLQVEGGGRLAGSLVDGGLVDEVMMFVAPKLIGGDNLSVKSRGARNIAGAVDLKDVRIERFGRDILVTGRI